MATTYLEAVNDILTEANEVELTYISFPGAVGVQKFVKNAVNRAYLEICASEKRWPFLAVHESNANEPYSGNSVIESAAGVKWYQLKPTAANVAEDYGAVDWDTFYITNHGVSGAVEPYIQQKLTYMPFKEWADTHRTTDMQSHSTTPTGYGVPLRVIQSEDGRYFGLSPTPDGIYKVSFTAWVQPSKLDLHDREILIPDMYMPTLLDKARYYMHFFKKDYEEATLAERAYKNNLSSMRRGLIGNKSDTMRDDRKRI
jgi:hypothetical protein